VDRAQILASGSADILANVRIYQTAEEALAPFQLVLATTARDIMSLPFPLGPAARGSGCPYAPAHLEVISLCD